MNASTPGCATTLRPHCSGEVIEVTDVKTVTEETGKSQCYSHTFLRGKDTHKFPRPTTVTVVDDKGKPKVITLTEYRKLRHDLFTVRHGVVNSCGHTIDLQSDPANNCHFCWFSWFNTHGELVESLDAAYKELGAKVIDATRGVKFRKNFLKFMGTLAAWKAAAEKEKNVESTTGTGSSIASSGSNETSSTEAA